MLATLALVVGLLAEAAAPGVERLTSPNGRIAVAVHTAPPGLSYDVLFDGKPLLAGATLALIVDGVRLGSTPRITAVARTSTDAVVEPPVRQTAASLADKHNELRLACAGGYAIVFRAYDLGVAYRFENGAGARPGEDHRRGGDLPLRHRRRRLLPERGELLLPTTSGSSSACGSAS